MLWNDINDLTGRTMLPAPYADIFAIRIPKTRTSWLVGPYSSLTKLATELRSDEDLWEMLTDLGVRLGLRATDTPSTEDRQVRYGDTERGVADIYSFAKKRKTQQAKPAIAGQPVPVNRRTDRETNVHSFWQTQTPQSHHIVEFNNLRDIGKSNTEGKRDMDYQQLPAVLLAAEFHQRYISAFLKQAHGMKKGKLRDLMPGMYHALYVDRSALFQPLWRITKVILEEAGLALA